MKKLIAMLLLAAFLLTGVVGCGGKEDGKPTVDPSKPPDGAPVKKR